MLWECTAVSYVSHIKWSVSWKVVVGLCNGSNAGVTSAAVKSKDRPATVVRLLQQLVQ